MKPAPAHFSPRYRSELVFRSAERLLATPPVKRPEHRPSRWLVLVAGVMLGIALATSAWKHWRNATGPSPIQSGGIATHTHTTALTPSAVRRDESTTAPAPAASIAENSPETTGSPPEAGVPRTPAGRRVPTPAGFLHATPTESAGSSTGTTSPQIMLVLRGLLRATFAKPIECELVLQRAADLRSSTVTGLVRFLSGESQNAAYGLLGKIDGRQIHLRESEVAWNPADLNDQTRDQAVTSSVTRRFELELPPNLEESEITGTWTIGAQSGILSLHPSPPW